MQSTYSKSKIMVNSVRRQDLSIKTPSFTVTNRSKSLASSYTRSFHMANPNPQNREQKYKGIRDTGYNVIDPTNSVADLVRFGKRVTINNKMTNDEIMDEHLKQIRNNVESNRMQKELRRKHDLEFLEHIKNLD